MPTIFLNKNQYASNGGKEMVLTQTQYDNLSEQDKMNGMTYYICDADSDKNGDFQPIIYSTNEREVGVWCDGKPLYQKTWTGLNVTIAYNNWTNIIANDFNAETLVAWEALTDGKNITGAGLEIQLTSSYISGEYNASANIRAIKTLTLVYTKTIDTAGSGSWTPGGIPAIHYSTDEHVIGTWVDGSTLYEKTLTYTNQTQRPSDWTTLETFSDINQVIKMDGFIDVSNGQRMSNQYYFRLVFQNNTLKYYCAELAAGNGDITATIQYTKTTS